MKLNFKISKWANFYYFLHNFAQCEWPWPYRPHGPITIWERRFGKFNKKEQAAIKQFKIIYKKYFLKIYLGKYFFEEKNPWVKLKKEILADDAEELRKIFSIFENKFEKIFQENNKFLKQWVKKSNLKIKSSEIKTVKKILNNLFGLKLDLQPFNVFFLLGRGADSSFGKYNSGAGGERGRGLKNGNMLLEIHIECPFEKIDYITGVISHEITHDYFASSSFLSLARKKLSNKNAVNYLEEVVIRSLLPIGILGIKFFNAPVPVSLNPFSKSRMPAIDCGQTVKIINLTELYIRQNKTLDAFYLKELVKILSEQKKWAALLN